MQQAFDQPTVVLIARAHTAQKTQQRQRASSKKHNRRTDHEKELGSSQQS